jgi:GNAT superfamily N-acetyltransferase
MDLQVRRLAGDDAANMIDAIALAYRQTYADSQTGEDFDHFRDRALVQFQSPGFAMVIATVGSEVVAFTYGVPLRSGSTWWKGIRPDPAPGFTTETGTRSFAVIELLVTPALQGQGLGRQLLADLLDDRPEERATLATDPREVRVQQMYERHGWWKVGRVIAAPEAPVPEFDLFVLPLS